MGELTLRGCYHGSNVSYNLKLVNFGYVSHRRSANAAGRTVEADRQGRSGSCWTICSPAGAQSDITSIRWGRPTTLVRLDRFWASQSDAYGADKTQAAWPNRLSRGIEPPPRIE